MIYLCNLCHYSTILKNNFNKHLECAKHMVICNENNQCNLCFSKFSCKKSLSKHKKDHCNGYKYIIKSQEDILEQPDDDKFRQKIAELENKLLKEQCNRKIAESKNEMLEEKCDMLKKDKDYFKDQLNKVNSTVENLSNFAYIKATYPNPPLFIALTENQIMHIFLEMEKKNILTYKKKGYDDTLCYYKQMIHYFDNKKIDKFFTDILSIGYKNEKNPSKQSVFSSDTSRLNYAITNKKQSVELDSDDSDYLEDDNKIMWTKDNSGIRTNKIAISPLLEYSDNILNDKLGDNEINIEESMKILNMKKMFKEPKFLNKINKRLSSELQLKR